MQNVNVQVVFMSTCEYDAFLSYARQDDQFGQITALRCTLDKLASKHLGRPVSIFQDKEKIRWGEQWPIKLRQALRCPCLIVIVSAPYLDSPWCSEELLEFARIEAEQQADDRIMPLYWDNFGAMEEALGHPSVYVKTYEGDHQKAFEILKNRQVKELQWLGPVLRDMAAGREMEPDRLLRESKIVSKLDEIASEIAEILTHTPPPQAPSVNPPAETRPASILLVEPGHSLAQAVREAGAGSRIRVQGPAEYRESIVVDKALELVAERGPVTLKGVDGPAITCAARSVRISGLHIWGATHNAVVIKGKGTYTLMEKCDVGPSKYSAVLVQDRAEAALVMCGLHDAYHCGAHAQLSSNCLIVDCKIMNNQVGGLFFSEDATGNVEANQIRQNGLDGIFIAAGASPEIRRNEIRDHQCGILVYRHWEGYGPSHAIIEDNMISDNRQFGIQIEQGADPSVRNNTISDNAWGGIWTRDNGRGVIVGNRILRNVGSGIKNEGGFPRIGNNIIEENRGEKIEDVSQTAVIDDKLALAG
jgi:parallel beta-helix repeat protein